MTYWKQREQSIPYMKYSTQARRQRHTFYKFKDDNGDVVALPGHKVNEVAGMMRCAVTKRVSPTLGQYVSGHGDKHVSYVPLRRSRFFLSWSS